MKRTVLALTLIVASWMSLWSQTVIIGYQKFESGDPWAIVTGAANVSGNTGSGDTPANQRIKSTSNSWQVNNGTATLELAPLNISGQQNVKVTINLSSTSVNTGNGSDAGDTVKVFVNYGSGFPASPDIILRGNSNARWGFNAVRDTGTTAGTPITVQAPQGGTNANNYDSLTISIPAGANSVALRIVANNNDANELWNIDDIYAVSVTVQPCPEPANQPTVLNLTPGASSVSGSFTASSGNPPANGYLVVRSTNPTLSDSPADGTTYSPGASLGGGTVVASGSSTTFTSSGLSPNTTYYFFVFAYYGATDCTGGPNYKTDNPLTGSTTTQNSGGGGSFSLISQFINPCGGDGQNELIVLKTGNAPVSIKDMAFGSINPNSGAQPNYNFWWAGANVPSTPNPVFTGTGSGYDTCLNNANSSTPLECFGFLYPSNSSHAALIDAIVTNMNSIAGCTVFLAVPSTDLIPPNSNVILFLGAGGAANGSCALDNPATNLAFTNHCNSGTPILTYYVVVGTGDGGSQNCGSTTGGYFSNSEQRISRIYTYSGSGPYDQSSSYLLSEQNYTPGTAPAAGNAGIITPDGTDSDTLPDWINSQGCVPPPGTILPVELLYFDLHPETKAVRLEWATASERNNDYFQIERSRDGIRFDPIGRVAGHGNSLVNRQYRFSDLQAPGGTLYYRLRQVDYDGNWQFSATRAIELPRTEEQRLRAYPSPANEVVHLQFEQKLSTETTLEVYDMTGRLHARQSLEAGTTEHALATAGWPAGHYVAVAKNSAENGENLMVRLRIDR